MLYKRILLAGAACLMLLAGCRSPLYNQTEGNVADVKEHIQVARHQSDVRGKFSSPLIINQGLYVDRTPISISRQPIWLKNRIVIRGDKLPFSYYSRTIVAGGGRVLSHYQNGIDEKLDITMNYAGTVKGGLDLLAAKTGYVYSINGNDIYWQAFVTRSFDVAFMPGSAEYSVGRGQAAGGGAAAASSAAGGTGGAVVSGMGEDSSFSNLKGNLSVWKDLNDSIKQLLSPDGKVMVSEATTTVTVRDHPTNVDLVARFIGNFNNNLSRQVLVKIQVLEISLDSAYNFGINWDTVQHFFGNSDFQLKANAGTPVVIQALGKDTSNTTLGFVRTGASGFGMLINALKQQGKVSVVSEPRVVCLNNQVSQVHITTQKGYLASLQTTNFAPGAGSNTTAGVTTQITPGTLVTGLTLYVLPKILGNRVYLQVNADLSNALDLQTITSNGAPAGASNTNTSIIQVPTIQDKQFNQRSVIASGDTLILSGFRQVSNNTGALQFFDSQALGGKAALQREVETIVLITPIILRGTG